MRIGARHLVEILVVVSVALAAVAGAQVKGFRWIDDEGNVHYAARRDQVPERYRAQLGPVKPGEPPKPQLTPNATGRAGTPRGCILRLRGTERVRGSSYSYADCAACRRALHALDEDDARRAECFASSIADELGKRVR
jgi:Domain of unknown function (DUF4124)